MIFKNIKNYFAAHPSSIGCTVHANAALALKSYARRRRAQVLKPSAPTTAAPSVTSRPSKVHFSDASLRRATSSSSPVRISLASTRSRASIPLPTRLERPLYREVDAEALAASSPEMKGLPVDYIRDALESIGAKMLSVLASTVTPPMAVASSSALPKEVPVTVRNAETKVLPTHMLAVHSSTQPALGARKVTLFPAHSLVLAAHCANLPALPASFSTPTSSADSSEVQLTLPVLPLALPSPETFAPLSSYLYTRRADALLKTLIPLASSRQSVADLSSSTLLAYALKIHGVWRNACALGVHDEKLWKVLDLAWSLCVGSLGKATGASA